MIEINRKGFLVLVFTCVFSWVPTFANAAAKAITWAYNAQTVTMMTTDTLTISWTGMHDVYYSTTGTCGVGTSKADEASSGSYTTTSGQLDVGTHYFYCSISGHCSSGMYVTVNVTKGNSAILNPSDVSYTATDINGATRRRIGIRIARGEAPARAAPVIAQICRLNRSAMPIN